jgi:hypothetical protein
MTHQRSGGEVDIMRPTIMALGACAMLVSAPVFAQSHVQSPNAPGAPGTQEPSGTELTLEGLGKLMLGLQRMVEGLPRYNLPEINENGDIIIRRIDPHVNPEQPKPPVSPDKGVEL